jgi:glutathione S-transferase
VHRPTLVTVPFSHFCEKARWALDHAGVDYVEDPHLPMLHWLATFRAGGGRTVPVLATSDGTLADSTDVVRWADRRTDPNRRLLPDGDRARTECDALEDELDEDFGPAVRQIGYGLALADRRLIFALATGRAPAWEYRTLRATFPLVKAFMLRAMAIDERSVAAARAKMVQWFDRIAARLRDGRPYLLGDRFSAADMTFAALAAPMVVPPEHPIAFPIDRFPQEAHDLWREMRAHPAGAFVGRLYAEHRRAVMPADTSRDRAAGSPPR